MVWILIRVWIISDDSSRGGERKKEVEKCSQWGVWVRGYLSTSRGLKHTPQFIYFFSFLLGAIPSIKIA